MATHRVCEVLLVHVLGQVGIWPLHPEFLVLTRYYETDIAEAIVVTVTEAEVGKKLSGENVVSVSPVRPTRINCGRDWLSINDISRLMARQKTVESTGKARMLRVLLAGQVIGINQIGEPEFGRWRGGKPSEEMHVSHQVLAISPTAVAKAHSRRPKPFPYFGSLLRVRGCGMMEEEDTKGSKHID